MCAGTASCHHGSLGRDFVTNNVTLIDHCCKCILRWSLQHCRRLLHAVVGVAAGAAKRVTVGMTGTTRLRRDLRIDNIAGSRNRYGGFVQVYA